MRSPALFAVLLVFVLSPATALSVELYQKEDFKIKLHGYLQHLLSSGEDPFFEDHVTDNTSRLRTTFKVLTGTAAYAEVSLDATYKTGGVLDSPLFLMTKDMPPPTYYNWERTCIDEPGRYGEVSVYRAMFILEKKKYRLVAGRQRLAYGTALFWSPVDIWNPVSPLALEPELKAGVDGFSATWWASEKLTFTGLAGMADDWDEARAALSMSYNIESYTLDFMAGKHMEDEVYAFDFVGYIRKAGIRGEFTYTVTEKGDDFPRAVLGMDYAFPNGLYVAGEYYYNGGPLEINPLAPWESYLNASGADTLNRNFVGATIEYDLNPLIVGSVTALYDVDEKSRMIGPSLVYYLSGSVTVSGGGQLFAGPDDSEFGRYPDLGWFKIRWNF